MNPVLIGLFTLIAFAGGGLTVHIIWVQRLQNTERLKRMYEAARQRGRMERRNADRGEEPPAWMP